MPVKRRFRGADSLLAVKPETRSYYELIVQRAVELVARHLDQALDLETIAREACLSPFHFHRIFRGMVGETPLELTRRLRLERAAWQLAQSDRPVTAIAFDAGYEAHEAFTRAFRTAYATSPTGFRERRYPRIELAASSGVHFAPDGAMRAFTPRDSGGRSMDVTIEQRPELRVGAVRHIGPYNQIPTAFAKLGQIVGGGNTGERHGEMLAIYYDDPETTPASELESDAALSFPPDATMPAGLNEHRIPGGRYARTTHVGPYEQLGDVWARFMGEWLPSSGNRLADSPSYEVYRNTPMDTPKEELRTDLYMPLG
jgi:AraC family transcriptional regulator